MHTFLLLMLVCSPAILLEALGVQARRELRQANDEAGDFSPLI